MAGKYIKLDAPVTLIHSNLDQTIIQITEDRLKLCLMEHIKKIEDSKSWIAPSSLLTTILITFATTQFKNFAGLSAESWKAVFFIFGLFTFAWLIFSIFKIRKAPTISDIVRNIKMGVN